MYRRIHCWKLSPILELSVKFTSQICHENINKPLDGAYLADFGIDIRSIQKIVFFSDNNFPPHATTFLPSHRSVVHLLHLHLGQNRL